jgi:fibronectin-binding autotransporter adhesin
LINNLKNYLAGRLLNSNHRVPFLEECAQKVGGSFLSRSAGTRRYHSAPHKVRAAFHSQAQRDLLRPQYFSTFYNHSNSFVADILRPSLSHSPLTNFQAPQITKFGANDMNASSFAVKNYAASENLARRILLIALLALALCPHSALAQSCPGTTSWNGGTGSWETAGDWSSGVPGATSNACINVASSTVNITSTSGDTTLNLDINLGTDILNIGNNTELTIQSGGNIINNGALNLNSFGNNTQLIIDGATTLSGTGTVTMSNSTNNYITGGGTFTNKQTIQGAGNIGNNSLTLVNSGSTAIIDANVVSTLQINPNGGTTNTGTLEATAGGVLELSGSTVANTGGLIQATGTGSTVELNDVSITGGTLTSSTGGVIESINTWNTTTPTLTSVTISSGSTVNVPNNNGLNLGAGTITNNGSINLQGTGNNTELVIAGSTTLSGTGTVTMGNNVNNIITGGGTLTNGETIQGAGTFGNGDLTLINNGIINANQSTALNINPNGGTTNNGTMEATAGGTLELSGSTIANGSGLIEATGTSSTVQLNDVSITGGTLTSSSGGVIESVNTWNTTTPTLTGLTISSGTTLDIPNNNGLNFGAGTITNNGAINLQGVGNNTELVIAGSTTLSGTGTVTMGNNANNIILGGGTLTNNQTIQGGGDIGDASLTLINNGTIDANQTSALTINPNGGTTNTKTLEATAGGTLVLATYAVNNTGGTILATGTGSSVQLNDVSITSGTLTSSSGGVIASANTWNDPVSTLNNLTISSGTNVDIPNNDGLDLGTGTIINNGTFNLQSSGNNTQLVITGGNVTLTGGGNVGMTGSTGNMIQAGTSGLMLTNVNNTISGAGEIGNGSGLLFVNQASGVVSASGGTLTINPFDSSTTTGSTTNAGLLEATAGGVLQLEDTITNTGGTILATGTSGGMSPTPSTVELNAVSITGGTLTSSSGGVIESINNWNTTTPTLTGLTISSGTTLDIPNNNGLALGAGTITNNGTINLQSSGNNTELTVAGSTTLSGTGTVTMSNAANNIITGGGTFTNGETIQGGGDIGNGSLTFVNNGTIDANQPTALTINANGGTTNTKTMEATAGGTLHLLDYTINNTGGTILATGTGSVVTLDAVSISGGTLTSSAGGTLESVNTWNSTVPTLTGLTISAGSTLDIPNNDGLDLGVGTITNKGTINLQSNGNNTELVIDGNVTLASTGKVIMSANANNIITGTGTLTNQNTIEGEGNIGDGQIGVINSGTIEANATKAPFDTLIIDTGSAGFTDNVGTKEGTLSVSKSNVLIIEGGPFNNFSSGTLTGGIYKVTGTLEFAAGSGIVTNDAAITLTGATAEILNTSNSTNALTQFADNGTKGTFTLATNTFNDSNVFTNSGIIAVGAGAKFNASNQLTNFSSTTSTLTGGSYTITGTGQFQFNNQGDSSDIVTNDAKITLAGVDTTKNSFIDQTGANALANYDANGSSGALYLTTNRNYATPGNFTNAGIVDVEKSTGTGHTELTINGTYTQTGGTTTVDGLLNASAFDITGGFVYGNAGAVAGAATLTGSFDITGGTINPGDGVKKAGKLNISGTYTQSGSGILNIDLDGTTAGTNYDVLDISGAATLGGTLDVDAIGTYKPTAGQQYDILDYGSVSGAFTTVDCTFSNGDGCTIAYDGSEAVLTITAAPGAASSPAKGAVSATPAHRVSRIFADTPAANTHEATAILSPATCFAARMIGSASCGDKASVVTAAHGSGPHEVASARTELNSAHNNVMVATRTISSARGGASHETSASASAMARLYVCAYLPSTVGHTMGCN